MLLRKKNRNSEKQGHIKAKLVQYKFDSIQSTIMDQSNVFLISETEILLYAKCKIFRVLFKISQKVFNSMKCMLAKMKKQNTELLLSV